MLKILITLAVLFLHLAGNPHYGFFRDELYFIMCGFRPALGYVDQPPLVPLLAAGSQIFGESLFFLRALPALFAAASVWVTCLLVEEMGGRAFAQILAATVAFFCPVLMSFGAKVSPDMVGLVLWPLTALLVLKVLRGASPRLWIYAGLALGLAFQAKYSVGFFAVALFAGLLISDKRRALLSPWCGAGVAVAALIALPNIYWQAAHGWPMLELLQNGQKGKNILLSPGAFLIAQLLITNPVLSLVWLGGLIWLLRQAQLRFLAVTYVVLTLEMILMHGKHYYGAGFYPVLIAAGGVAWERVLRGRRWAQGMALGTAIAAGLVMVPYVMPVLPVAAFVKYHQTVRPLLGMERIKSETHREGSLPQEFADMHGWPELAAVVRGVAQTLTPEELAAAVIVAQNYGQAAAIEFFGRDYDLPPVISGHNQYFLWGTRGRNGAVVIDVAGDCGGDQGFFEEVKTVARFSHPYVMPYENNMPIMICRGMKTPLSTVWPSLKKFR